MGPVRYQGEALSSFRFRYARYCLAWFLPLGLGLFIFLSFSPSLATTTWPLVVMFLYIGLPIGAATAFLALVGFVLAACWAQIAESSVNAERVLNLIKFSVLALFAAAIFALAMHVSLQGLLSGEVAAFSKKRLLIVRVEEPGWFYFNVICWAGAGIFSAYFAARKLRSVYAS